uniref:Uncharacterized protein n=1 Tax=Arundo donax TaxID=35708 RepID=A0A0A9HDG9_ARUDO
MDKISCRKNHRPKYVVKLLLIYCRIVHATSIIRWWLYILP